MSNPIEVSTANGVQVIRMNRPDKKNALTAKMYGEMAAAVNSAKTDPSIKASLFLGVRGAFSAGNDIADFMQIAMTGKRSSMDVFDFLEAIIMSEKPLLAGVDGLAIGVGTTMLMHCDYVIASDTSSFSTPFVDLGLVPEAGSSLIAPRIMGHHKAFELLALGAKWSAGDASSAGLVNKVVASAELESVAVAVSQTLAAKPPEALAISRKLIRGDRSDILARMKEEAVLFGERLSSDEAKAAFLAFMAKGQKKAG